MKAHKRIRTHDATTESGMSYGLNLRQSRIKNTAATAGSKSHESMDGLIKKKLIEELDKLPEPEDVHDVLAEGIGATCLASYGWYEGRGIGKNRLVDVGIVQYERRAGRSGLGFVAPGINNNNDITKKKVEKEGYFVVKEVMIVRGRRLGSKGRIVKIMAGGNYVVLMVLNACNEVKVKVPVKGIADFGSMEEERCLKELKEWKFFDRGMGRVPWLKSNIRVKIISRDFEGGKLFLETGKVVDVVEPTICDVTMDDSGEFIRGVGQQVLETALPRIGGPVLVLYGKYKGVYGSIVEKYMEKETASVQDADTREVFDVKLQQIAEYIGDPSELGYY